MVDAIKKEEIKVKEYYIKIERHDWIEVSNRFNSIESFLLRKRERMTTKLIKKYDKKGLFLDLGCGTGLILRNLPPGSIGLDISSWNLKKARAHAPLSELIVGDAENLPFKEGAFSTIICTEVLEHLENPRRSIEEIHRVLETNGVLIGSVPHNNFLWKLRFLSTTCPSSEPFHKLYRIEEVRKLLSKFKILTNKISLLRLYVILVAEKRYRNK